MDSSHIDLKGSEIAAIASGDGELRIELSRAYIVKSMTGSKERTRWWQAGRLILEGLEPPADIPTGPLVCAGGDLEENVYTYRDMIPIPFASRGHIRCLLRFEGCPVTLDATARSAHLVLVGVPKYIEHIRP